MASPTTVYIVRSEWDKFTPDAKLNLENAQKVGHIKIVFVNSQAEKDSMRAQGPIIPKMGFLDRFFISVGDFFEYFSSDDETKPLFSDNFWGFVAGSFMTQFIIVSGVTVYYILREKR